MGVYQRGERWLVYYHVNGKRHDKSFGRGDLGRARAEKFDQAVRQSVEQGLPVPDPEVVTALVQVSAPATGIAENPATAALEPVNQVQGHNQSGMLLSELSRRYVDHMRASGRTAKHILSIEHLLLQVFIPILGDKPVDEMTYQGDMVPFIIKMQGISHRTGKARSQLTINKYCDYLSFIFNFGIDNGFTTKNPLKRWKKPKVQPWDMKLNFTDAQKIMSCAEPHLKWAMEVCFNLGTRPGESELLSLKWDDVDFKNGVVRIYASKTKSYRSIPINQSFLKRLEQEKATSQTDYVIEYMGRNLTTIRKAFKNACKRAGITYSTRMYDLRHLFATTLLNKGADLAAVSKLMGHSTVKLTADTYYHYMEGEKERAVQLLPELMAG